MATVLVVEDDAAIGAILTRRLQQAGYQVFSAVNGADGSGAAADQQPGGHAADESQAGHEQHSDRGADSLCDGR
jgi:CheY-like chemotaxis protein